MPQESFTVYVVDDDESIRRALKRLLRSAGYHAVTFNSAEDFMETTSGRGEGCLVLDIRLPGMTGLDLQAKLAALGGKYPVIFMTAHDNPQWREMAKKAGAVAYLRKPFDEESLLNAIRLAGGREHG
jgi:FixJ family two-component response regulator